MAHSTAARTALPWNTAQTTLHTVTAMAWASFLAGINLFGDDRMAAAHTLPMLRSHALLWLEEEMTRTGMPGFEGPVLPA
ncbi:hypothetical protein ABZY20_18860 [Streptomyces sp. NPDC006624]|uniref:hypothetical protein n=1 Tax=Streptomyces sp. NPDC006624 TaxID=3154892 RepID=UPI0033A23E1E